MMLIKGIYQHSTVDIFSACDHSSLKSQNFIMRHFFLQREGDCLMLVNYTLDLSRLGLITGRVILLCFGQDSQINFCFSSTHPTLFAAQIKTVTEIWQMLGINLRQVASHPEEVITLLDLIHATETGIG